MHKATKDVSDLLEQALIQWKDNCPGAGWEHHNTSALVSLALTPAMQTLIQYAAIGLASAKGADLAELRHIADRVYDSNPEARAVREAYVAAARAAESKP